MKKKMIHLAGKVAVFLVDTLIFSCRMERVGDENIRQILKSGRFIMASWHGHLLLLFIGPRDFKTAVMTSRSKDGDIGAWLQKSGGYRVFRGSSRKGGRAALDQMVEYMVAESQPTILSVDGPTGPIYKCKQGVVDLAAETGFPIIPITFSGSPMNVLRSWDRCLIPKPFAKCRISYGQPIHVPKKASMALRAQRTKMVEDSLNQMTEEANEAFGLKIK